MATGCGSVITVEWPSSHGDPVQARLVRIPTAISAAATRRSRVSWAVAEGMPQVTTRDQRDDKDLFRVVEVTADADSREQIGSKAKFWFREAPGNERWLFKEARARTGEDWAEKLAAEIAGLLGLPHATVELARHRGTAGIVTKDFTETRPKLELVHGNELLFELDSSYPKTGGYRVHQHTLDAVHAALDSPSLGLPSAEWPDAVISPWRGFIGYLMLDALIGNTDRHHQNWGVLAPTSGKAMTTLSPTFDHASSLGRELDDRTREQRLTTPDPRASVSAYAARARSAFYGGSEPSPLTPADAFAAAAATAPEAGRSWLERLHRATPAALQGIVARVPGPTMSDPARRFALALLNENRARLERVHVR